MSDISKKTTGPDHESDSELNEDLDDLFGSGDVTPEQGETPLDDDFFSDAPMPKPSQGFDDLMAGDGASDENLLEELEDILEQAEEETDGHLDDILGEIEKAPAAPPVAEPVAVDPPVENDLDEDDALLAEIDPLVDAAQELGAELPEGVDPMDELNAVLAADIEDAELDEDPIMSELEALLGDLPPEALDEIDVAPEETSVETPQDPSPDVAKPAVIPAATAAAVVATQAPKLKAKAKTAADSPVSEGDDDTLLFPDTDELEELDEWNPEEDLANMWDGGPAAKVEERSPEDDAALEAILSAPIHEEAAPDAELPGTLLPTTKKSRALVKRNNYEPTIAMGNVMAPATSSASDGHLDTVLRMGTRRRSRARKWFVRLFWVALLAGLTYVAFLPYDFEVGGDFTVLPGEIAQVRARTDGEVIKIMVRQGDWVEEGQVMAVLSNWDEERDIAVRQAEVDKLEAHLRTLLDGARPEEIALAEQAVVATEVKVDIAKRSLDRQQQLFDTGTVSQVVLDQAKGALALALSEAQEAKTALELVNSGARDSEVAAARADIARNQEDLAYAIQQLENTNIRAVTDGRIVSSFEEVPVGAYLTVGGLFAELEDNRTVYAAIDVPETEIDEVVIGATAELKLWSSSDDPIYGTVLRIAPKAEERDFGQVIPVTIEVPNEDGRLATGITGYGKVGATERPVWAAFTRIIVRFFQVELWSWVP